MEFEETRKLNVKYHGKTVGYLAELKNGSIIFQYDEEWIRNGFSVSPLSLPLSNKKYISNKPILNGLYGVFWDSLPDGWSELLVRRMLAKHGIDFDKLSPLQKLSITNKNGLGALEYEPNKGFMTANDDRLDLDVVAKEAEALLNDDAKGVDLDLVYNLGGSSGGARPKAHIIREGFEWIVKFPCSFDPKNIGTREFKANELAKKCGINVNEFKLFDSKICDGFFASKRFDRKNGNKVHMISLSALLETTHRLPNLDYGHLFQVIYRISIKREEDLYEAFRRMCFNVFYKNKDDHGKNFSFIYDEELKGYRLSPAYDTTSQPNKAEHEMTVNMNGKPTEADLLQIGRDFNLSRKKCEETIKTIKNVLKTTD